MGRAFSFRGVGVRGLRLVSRALPSVATLPWVGIPSASSGQALRLREIVLQTISVRSG
jgi:hypothetical protein